MRVVGLLTHPQTIERILDHLRRPSQPQPRPPSVKGLLEKATDASAGDLVERVFAGVEEFADSVAQYDDITVMAVRYLASFSQPTRT